MECQAEPPLKPHRYHGIRAIKDRHPFLAGCNGHLGPGRGRLRQTSSRKWFDLAGKVLMDGEIHIAERNGE